MRSDLPRKVGEVATSSGEGVSLWIGQPRDEPGHDEWMDR